MTVVTIVLPAIQLDDDNEGDGDGCSDSGGLVVVSWSRL